MFYFPPGSSQRQLDNNAQNKSGLGQAFSTVPQTVLKNVKHEERTRLKGRRPFGADLTNTSRRVGTQGDAETTQDGVLKTAHVGHRRSKKGAIKTPDWLSSISKPLRLDGPLFLDEDGDVMMSGITQNVVESDCSVACTVELGPKSGDEWEPSTNKEIEGEVNNAFAVIAKYRRPFVVNEDSVFHAISTATEEVMEKVSENEKSVVERKKKMDNCLSLLITESNGIGDIDDVESFLEELLHNHCDIPYEEDMELANGHVTTLLGNTALVRERW